MEERAARAGVLDVIVELHRLKPRNRAGFATPGPTQYSIGDDPMAVKMEDVERWIDEAVKDDRNFETKDLDPNAQKAKQMIKDVVMKLKGRVF